MQNLRLRASAYIAKMPPAISGQGGHTATYRVARILVKDFALDETTASELLAQWNETHCQPRWSGAELRHKLKSAARAGGPVGRLVEGRAPVFSQASARPAPPSAAEKRREWPAFAPPTPEEMRAIAALRHLPLEAVRWCAHSGFLRTASVSGHRSFILTEGNFAQARRFDGAPFTRHDGTTIKAKNLPGSEGAFLGRQWIGTQPPVLLVEGAIGLLEAVAAILLADRTDWTVLAATSAGARFERDPDLLQRLAGRRVRVVPDTDESGLDGAATWQADLQRAGAIVDAMAPPCGGKDLGDALARRAADPPALHTALSRLFQP